MSTGEVTTKWKSKVMKKIPNHVDTIIPRPKALRWGKGLPFKISGFELVESPVAQDLRQVFSESCREQFGEIVEGKKKLSVHVSWSSSKQKTADSYRLRVTPKEVKVWAPNRTGLLYALHTLLGLVRSEGKSLFLSPVEIEDGPDFSMRGISDDISRRQVSTVDDFCRIIRDLSRWRYNYYLLYMEDMFQLDRHPAIGAASGALTKDEVRIIVAYGKLWGVEIVPIVQTLGHLEKVLALPEYQDLSETTQDPASGHRRVLDIGNPKSYELLSDLFAELFEVFDSDYVHIGCDETRMFGTERNKEKADKIGHAALFIQHLQNVMKILRPHHKKIMFYADMFNPSLLHTWKVTEDQLRTVRDMGLIFVNWDYEKRFTSQYYQYLHLIQKQNGSQIVGPGTWCWQALYPSSEMVRQTSRVFLKLAYEEGLREAYTSSWCDRGDNLRLNNSFVYAQTAEYLWNIGTMNVDDGRYLIQRFCASYYGIDQAGLAEAYEFLGSLPWRFFEVARHDVRYPDHPNYFPFAHTYLYWSPARPGTGEVKDIRRGQEQIKEINQLLKKLFPLLRTVNRNRASLEGIILALKQCRFTLQTVVLSSSFKPPKALALAKELNEIKKEFSRLWLATSKPQRLDILEDRYNQLIAYYRALGQSPVGGPYPSTLNIPSPESFINSTSYDLVRKVKNE
jgi:hypothetical protein